MRRDTLNKAARHGSWQTIAPALAAGALLLSGAAGCSGPAEVARRDVGFSNAGGTHRGEGSGWALVLATAEGADAPGDEHWRRDAALGAGAGSAYPLDMYPATGPSLDDQRRLSVPTTPGSWLYFSERSRSWYDARWRAGYR